MCAKRPSHVGLLYDAKQVAVRVLEDNEIRAWTVPPRVTGGPERQQPFDLRLLITRVKIDVQPVVPRPSTIARLKREIGPAPLRVAQHDPASARGFPGDVSESASPERNGTVELVAMRDDRTDACHRACAFDGVDCRAHSPPAATRAAAAIPSTTRHYVAGRTCLV